MSDDSGRIPESVFQVITGVFSGVAILAAAGRITIHLRLRKRLGIDDYFLLASCTCLIAGTGVIYHGLSTIYFIGELSINPALAFSATRSGVNLVGEMNFYQKIKWSYMSLTWTSIFAVKFGFLSFFRTLINRVPHLYNFWKGVVVFTFLAYAICVCYNFFPCHQLGPIALQCLANPATANRALAIGTTAISLDLVTDVLILIIPISIIWRVRIKTRQKIGIAAFLCLSICMIVIAVIRVSGVHYESKFDITWIGLWQQVQSCVAVVMLSLTAIRSIYVSNTSNRGRPNKGQWVPSTRRFFGRNKKSTFNHELVNDIAIPSATITGMSQFMGRMKASTTHPDDEPLATTRQSEGQKLTKETWTNTEDGTLSGNGWPLKPPEAHHQSLMPV